MNIKPLRQLTKFTALFFLLVPYADCELLLKDQVILMDSLEVTLPAGENWQLAQKSEYKIAYINVDRVARESEAAFASAYAMPHPKTKDGFLELVKSNVVGTLVAFGFKQGGEIEYVYTDERAYPCVRAAANGTSSIKLLSGDIVDMTTQYRMFICRYPDNQEKGFVLGFSRIGIPKQVSIEPDAEAFFKGVSLK